LRADIELTCYTPTGIEAIKKALRAGEEASTEAVPIKAKLVAPPLYVLSTNATDKVRDEIAVSACRCMI
jgi:translation initiation factor 2 subunit 1